MAGATNKSAKRLGYTKAQIQTERAKGGVLSHAALLASGAPARPTKAHKALVEAMAERKKGLTRKADSSSSLNAERERQDRVVTRIFADQKQIRRTAKSIDAASRVARDMRQKAAAAAAAPQARGPATARLQKLRTMRQESNAARAAWVAEAKKANPGGDITTFTPAMRALGKVSTQKRNAYEAAAARSTKDMNRREDSTRAIAVRFQRVADRTSRKADAARAAGDSAAADRLAARAKDLYRRRNEAFKRAERYSTTSMSYERLSRLKR